MNRHYNRKIILEDGGEFYGYSFGADREAIAEIVFNTSMVGYQEILSDPSYTGQAVVMTYPLIGNYGICADDFETKTPTITAMIVREYNDEPSNFRAVETLRDVMLKFGIVGLAGVDTRALARHIRDKGTCKALICDAAMPNIVGVAMLKTAAARRDQVAQVSTKTPWIALAERPRFHVVAVDCGIKHNIIRSLNRRGCDVTVVPWNISANALEALHPDGVFLSNGPGNPEDVTPVIELVRQLRGKYPIFGICLGH
ncbi:MAG: carbamoyl phosphate synthase small subunit, partial [Oscillospiraceae bacterium]|nr:carbamoyl phosphate synthase small subunit [Oscillospiraceae bacterium]